MSLIELPGIVPSPTSQSWEQVPNTETFQTAPVAMTETYERPGTIWRSVCKWTNLPPRIWRPFSAWIAQMRGAAGRFHYGPRMASAPQATIPGTPVVNGAGQGGNALSVRGVSASAVLAQPGDFFSVLTAIALEVKIVTQSVSAATAGGITTLVFEPPLRGSPADGTALTFAAPNCLMRLASDKEGASDNGKFTFTVGNNAAVTLTMTEHIGVSATT